MKRFGYFLLGLIVASLGWIFLSDHSPAGNVAVVRIEGTLFDSDPLVRELQELKEESSVQAVVLRIDSPGGGVGASQEIHQAVKELAETKKVVASLGSVAASGGYYVALPAHKIVANPGTVTGSIGVRMEHFNLADLLAWGKVRHETLKSGALKDIGSNLRDLTPEEKVFLEEILKKMHQQFKTAVQEGRHLEVSVVDSLAEGQIFTGEEAKGKGLVDELGNFQTAIRIASDLAGIKGKPDVFYPEPDYDSFMEKVLGETLIRVGSKFHFCF